MNIVRIRIIRAAILLATPVLASCSASSSAEENAQSAETAAAMASGAAEDTFAMEERGQFDRPWAMAFEPGTGNLFITEKRGKIRFLQPNGRLGTVGGVPTVDYGGQGGLGDIAFAPDYTETRSIYLSWAEAGSGDTRGAAVGRGMLVCEDHDSCDIRDLRVIWRQPKVTGRGHYSHRLAFSPDGQYLFVASGDRQKKSPAQNTANPLGSIVRLLPDGAPAPGNPLAGADSADPAIWSWGHRNILGLGFDGDGRLWDLEHGPKGGDELNLVKPGTNYGWPVVSNGIQYNGRPIPDHSTRPDFAAPAISWTPVIAPGDMLFVTGAMFPSMDGDLLIAGLKSKALILVGIDGDTATEQARYRFGKRLRALAQAPDGAIWVAEDGPNARLWRLTPHNPPPSP